MAALLVGMAVMAVMLSVAMPAWNQMIRREKEEELIFRGNQYARAINQYQRKFANANPPSIDALVEQRLLRKKFKDPMSPEKSGEFQLLYLSNSAQPGGGGQTGQQTGRQGSSAQPGMNGPNAPGQAAVGSVLGTTPTGGIAGVTSKNKSESLRVFNGKTHYNEWQFVGMQQSNQAGGPGGAAAGARGNGPQGGDRPGGMFPGSGGRQGPGGREGNGRDGSGRQNPGFPGGPPRGVPPGQMPMQPGGGAVPQGPFIPRPR